MPLSRKRSHNNANLAGTALNDVMPGLVPGIHFGAVVNMAGLGNGLSD